MNDFMRENPYIDPRSVAMCTECRRLVQRREMKLGTGSHSGQHKLLCPECLRESNRGQQIAAALVGEIKEKNDANLDPEMKKLKDKLEKNGLM